MYSFKNDYAEGAHPAILNKLIETNLSQEIGYGEDRYSVEAKSILQEKIKNPDASIHFVSGGTQANLLVISALLRPHEAVISANTGHIYSHETGAIESIGHRIITIDTANGKLNAGDISLTLKEYSLKPHVVKPKLVYISNSTELGTIYQESELTELSSICKANNLILFMDGARLGHALVSKHNDVSLSDIAALTDVFYIGATKNGALLGEAIIFNNPALAVDFDYILKQKGALLAKGRVLGIQFMELFRENLYFTLADYANRMAEKIADAIASLGYTFLTEPYTNQLFPILPDQLIRHLEKNYGFYIWKKIDGIHSAVRIITSWTTDENKVDEFIADLTSFSKTK